MEVTNGLLSNLVETKSMETVLAPIASQVSQLIILCESKEGWRPNTNSIRSAQNVREIIEELIETAKLKTDQSKMESYRSDMYSACELLSLAAENFYQSVTCVSSNSQGRESSRRVVQSAKDVLQGTMKVLLIADESEVKGIQNAADKVKVQLQNLLTVANIQELVNLFRSFTESLIVLTSLATRRQKDLVHPRQRERVIMGMGALKKAVPLLNSSLKSYVKHSTNSQAKVSRDYAVKQIESGLSDIQDGVSNRFMEEDYLGLEESGFFVSRLDQLLEALTEVGREDIPSQFDVWTQDVITHSMSVAHLCTDGHRDVIISNCQRILHQKGRVSELCGCMNSSQVTAYMKTDYDEVCECLIDELCDLERHVNMATLQLIVCTFWRTTDSLDRLAKAAVLETTNGNDWLSVLNDHIVEFAEHADKVCQVASLAAASSTDCRRVRCIRLCIHRIEQLDPDIVPAAVACLRSNGDKLAIQHMKLLKEEWHREFEDLLQVIDDMTDPRIFMQVTEDLLTEDLNACNGLLLLKDIEELVTLFPSIAGKARRVVQVAKRLADDHEDPLYRNGLMVYVERLRKVVVGTSEALSRVEESPNDETELKTLKRRLRRIPEGVGLVREALNKSAHPDLLSPLRLNIRQSKGTLKETQPKVNFEKPSDAQLEKTESAQGNPYLAEPPPYWSDERRRDETKLSLSLTESPSKKKYASAGVQCRESQNIASKTVQTESQNREQTRPDAPKTKDLKPPPKEQESTEEQSDKGNNFSQRNLFQENKKHQHLLKYDNPTDSPIKSILKERKSQENVLAANLSMSPAESSVESSAERPKQSTTPKLSPALRPRVVRYADSSIPDKDHAKKRESNQSVQFNSSPFKTSTPVTKSRRNFGTPKEKTSAQLSLTPLPKLQELDNPIVHKAAEMSRLAGLMEKFGKSAGSTMSPQELLKTAKSLSSCGQTILKYLKAISTHCQDKRFSDDLSYHIHHVSMATVQLEIISGVSISSPDDRSTDEMLLKSSKRLMTLTAQALRVAETASVKGLHTPSSDTGEYINAFILLMKWKSAWELQRQREVSSQDKDELGLRRMNLHNPPSLAELILT